MRIAMAGDAMLGRGVGQRLRGFGPEALFSDDLRQVVAGADLFLVNLECCVSERGEPWPQPGKAFFFRAPPAAVDALAGLGVGCVTLANNHALDFGADALADTRRFLAAAGIEAVGAGTDRASARAPVRFDLAGTPVVVAAVTDHPADFDAGPDYPGVAYAPLWAGVPDWLREQVLASRQRGDVVVVTIHWGPNLTAAPAPYIRRVAADLRDLGVSLVAGHSAHVFHGAADGVFFDLGDLIDDYRVDPELRNDLGLVAIVTLDRRGVRRVEAVPITLEYAHTRLAVGEEYQWVRDRFTRGSAALGGEVVDTGDRLVLAK